MRIELDQDLEKLLNEVKGAEPSIYGRGHVETVRFLATYYKTHKQLEALFREMKETMLNFFTSLDAKIERSLEHAMLKAAARAFSTLLSLADEKQLEVASQRAD